MSWTPEREATAIKLWNAGFSAKQVAEELGGFEGVADGGRGAVLAKIDRLRENPGKVAARSKVNNSNLRGRSNGITPKMPSLPKDLKVYEEAPPLPEVRRLSLIELTSDTCRWPHGDPGKPDTFFFCGTTTKEGSPYCPYHSRRAYISVA